MVYPNKDPGSDTGKVIPAARDAADAMICALRAAVDEARNASLEEDGERQTIITGLRRIYSGLKAPDMNEKTRRHISLSPNIASQIRLVRAGGLIDRVELAFRKAFSDLQVPEDRWGLSE